YFLRGSFRQSCNSILRCPSVSDGRLSYQFLSNGYIRRSVYAYDGAKPLSEYPSGNQQHHHVSKRICHSAISHFQTRENFLGIKAAEELKNRRNQHTNHQNR